MTSDTQAFPTSNGNSDITRIYRTQKVHGLFIADYVFVRLISSYYKSLLNQTIVLPYWSKRVYSEPFEGSKLFIRPCPLVPRHGFVDSRVIEGVDEIRPIWEEMRSIDPDGMEMLIMPVASGRWSAVITDGVMEVGKGHDGATSGKDSVRVPFPAQTAVEDYCFKKDLNLAGINTDGGLFVEVVEHQGKSELVQLRGGPKVGACSYYAPEKITAVSAAEVVYADCDLVELDNQLEKAAQVCHQDANAVVFVVGGGLACHAAVQSVSKGLPTIPVRRIQDMKKYVGLSLTASDTRRNPTPTKEGLIKVRETLKDAISTTEVYPAHRYLVDIACMSCHCAAVWPWDEEHLLRLRALGVWGALSLGFMAVAGEARHWYKNGPGRRDKEPPFELKESYTSSTSRDLVYMEADVSIEAVSTIDQYKAGYSMDGWANQYGGEKWEKCAETVETLYHALKGFLVCSDQVAELRSGWQKVVSALNELVHVSHNGGKLLTKFSGNLDQFAHNGAFIDPAPIAWVMGWQELPKFSIPDTDEDGNEDLDFEEEEI